MRNLYFLPLILLLFLAGQLSAQVGGYSFAASSGTFTPLSGGTAVTSSSSAAAFLDDDVVSDAIPIGFGFVFDGVTYTDVKMSTNGFITFTSSTSTYTSNNLATGGSSSRPLLAPLWDDLAGTSGSSAANYKLEGTPGTQVFTAEWLNWQWNYDATGATISFQVKLYEGTNKIEFVYRQESGSVNSGSASIGLAGVATGAGNYLSLSSSGASPTASSTTETANISTKPATGQVYTFTPQTCFAPSAIVSSAVTTNSATITFTEPASSPLNGYQYEVRTSGAAGSGATGLAASGTAMAGAPTFDLTTLTPSTAYNVYVRSNCGSGDYSIWASASFVTQCAAITTLPWTENFDALSSVGTTVFPVCWLKENGDWRTSDASYASQNDPRSAPNYLTIAWSATDEFIWTPGFQLTNGTSYDFSFWFTGDGYDGWTGDVFYNTSQTGTGATQLGSSFITSSTVSTATYAQVKNTFVAPADGVYYFAIRVNATSNPWYLGFDDFKLELTPSCEEPIAVAASAVTGTTATISFTEPASTPLNGYEYEVRTSGAAGSGATGLVSSGTVMVGSPTFDLTALTPQTTYQVYVRSHCVGTDYSTWSNGSFTTGCAAISVLPWSENFDTLSSVGSSVFPQCWLKQNGDWSTANAATTSYNDPRSAPNYLIERYSATDEIIWTPGFQLTSGTSYDFSFWFAGDGSTGWTGDVLYNNSQDGTGATQLGSSFITSSTTSSSTYAQVINSFTPSMDGVYYFGIRVNASFTPNYLGFDDFKVQVTPTCGEPGVPVVSAVTTTTAQVDWTAPLAGSPLDYQLYYSTSNTAPTAATTPTVTGISGNTTSLSSLTPATTYYVWVRSNCGATDQSAWSSMTTFTTQCNAVTLPVMEGFESGTSLPACWSRQFVSGNKDFVIGSNTTAAGNTPNPTAYSGTNRLWFNSYSGNGSQTRLVSAPLNTTTVSSVDVQFQWYFSSNGGSGLYTTEGVQVQVSTDGGATWTDEGSLIRRYGPVTGWSQQNLTLTGAGGQPNVLIGFLFTSNAGYESYMDSIVIRETPNCLPPTALVISNITNNAAQVDFTAPAAGSPVNYEVYYSPSNTAPGASTVPQVTGVTSTTANLSGLTAATKYYVWVRSYCGGTDRSDWSVGTDFTTLCDPATLPLNQGFNASTLPVCWSTSIVAVQTASKISLVTSGSSLTAAPQEGTHFVRYNSYSSSGGSSGSEERLISAPLTSTGINNLDVRFNWYEDGNASYSSGSYLNEGVTVEWSADGTTWNTAQYFPRHVDGVSTTGQWSEKSVNIPGAANLPVFYVAFKFHSEYGYNMYLDNVTVLASVSLPVAISSFTGKLDGEANLLSWTTSTEANNRGFEIQRSADGSNFSTIGFVASKGDNGNSNSTLSYRFADTKPVVSSYYRLKQVDNDGKFQYSNTVLLVRKSSEISLSSVYPNPAGERLNLVIASPRAAKVSVIITDLSGRMLKQSAVQLAEGSNNTVLPVAGLASGTYLLKLVCENGCESAIVRFVKQ